jgi:hypothetical protein
LRTVSIGAAAAATGALGGDEDRALTGRGGRFGEVALDRDNEFGEVSVAGDAAEPAFGFDHPGSRSPERHLARPPALDVAARAPDALNHRLARVRRGECALQRAVDAEAGERERLLHPLTQ